MYYRSCEKMLSLQKKTDSKLFDRACNVCRINQIYRGDGLESVISAIGKNIADEDAETSTVIPTNHENTRGSAQYK